MDFQSPCLGTLFARFLKTNRRCTGNTSFNPHVWGLFLQDGWGGGEARAGEDFQSPCLGTLFARKGKCNLLSFFHRHFQSPCLGTLFASRGDGQHNGDGQHLSIPMSGDSFCKSSGGWRRSSSRGTTFNPHVWGLFLQAITTFHLA